MLLSSGMVDEAYHGYGLLAKQSGTYLAWLRAVRKKYPYKKPAEILDDLVNETPGIEGKWFAAAKSAGLFEEALALVDRSPCSPQTLTRAARDYADENADFAVGAGLAALRWLLAGYGYEITATDVLDALSYAMKAAERAGRTEETLQKARTLVAVDVSAAGFVSKVLGPRLGTA